MSDRPTPETDAATHDLSDYGSPVLCSCGDWVAADYARKLERERDKARTELEMWRDGNILHEIHRNELEKTERERDEAREKLESEMKWHHQTHRELIEAQCKLLDIEYDKLKS
jgi:hypothetical protein